MAGIPIISDVLNLADNAIDKIWPDKNEKMKIELTKEELREKMRQTMMTLGFEKFKLLLQDIQGAREVFVEELKAKNVPKWARAVQVLARQYALYVTVSLYVYSKTSPHLAKLIGADLPPIELNSQDYWLIGTVFVFLFGARTMEKIKGVDKN